MTIPTGSRNFSLILLRITSTSDCKKQTTVIDFQFSKKLSTDNTLLLTVPRREPLLSILESDTLFKFLRPTE